LDVDNDWEQLCAQAEAAMREKKFFYAETLWMSAVQESEEFGPADPRLAKTLERLAEAYWSQGKFRQAEQPANQAFQIYTSKLGSDHSDLGDPAERLAMIYHWQGKYGLAEPLFKQAIAIKTKVLGGSHPKVVSILQNYADLLCKTHREEEAKHFIACIESLTKGRWGRSQSDSQQLEAVKPALLTPPPPPAAAASSAAGASAPGGSFAGTSSFADNASAGFASTVQHNSGTGGTATLEASTATSTSTLAAESSSAPPPITAAESPGLGAASVAPVVAAPSADVSTSAVAAFAAFAAGVSASAAPADAASSADVSASAIPKKAADLLAPAGIAAGAASVAAAVSTPFSTDAALSSSSPDAAAPKAKLPVCVAYPEAPLNSASISIAETGVMLTSSGIIAFNIQEQQPGAVSFSSPSVFQFVPKKDSAPGPAVSLLAEVLASEMISKTVAAASAPGAQNKTSSVSELSAQADQAAKNMVAADSAAGLRSPSPQSSSAGLSTEEAARVRQRWTELTDAAKKATDNGSLTDALNLWNEAVIEAELLGPRDRRLAQSLDSQGEILFRAEKYGQAEIAWTRAMQIKRDVIGTEHSSFVYTINNLAKLHYVLARYSEAERYATMCLNSYEKIHGSNHPNVATSAHNLATMYHVQGRYGMAEEFYLRGIAVRKQVLGADHPDTKKILQNYSELVKLMGRDKEAKAINPEATGRVTGTWKLLKVEQNESLLETCQKCGGVLKGDGSCPNCR